MVTLRYLAGLGLFASAATMTLAAASPAEAQVSFGPTINVSQTSGTSRMPHMVIDAAGTLHIAWTDDFEILYKRSFNGGQTFTPAIQISSSGGSSLRPRLAVFGGAVYVVWTQTDSDEIMFSRSLNGGASFSPPVNISNTPGQSLEGRIAAGPDGVIYVVWDERSPNRIAMSRSFDGGATFEAHRTIFGIVNSFSCSPGQTGGACTPYPGIAVDPANNRVYLIWHDLVGGRLQVRFSRSLDRGTNFSAPLNVSNAPIHAHCAAITVGPSGRIMVAWEYRKDLTDHKHDAYYAQSVDGGASFSPPINLSKGPSWASSDYPWAVEAPNGLTVVGWEDNTQGGNLDAVVAVSTNGGASFSESIDISNNDTTDSTEVVTLFGPDGTLYVAWEDYQFGDGEILLRTAAGGGGPPPPAPAVFTGGVFVAAADLDGDGVPDLITGADAGGGPHVRAFDSGNAPFGLSFFAYHPAFRGGVRVAACDFDGDGVPEIVTAPGPGGGPHVRVFKVSPFTSAPLAELGSFFAYHPAFSGGVYVACGDVTGDGVPKIITGAGEGGGPHVRVWTVSGQELFGFFAYHPGFTGGVRVAVGDVNGDGVADIITGPGPGGGPHVRVFTLAGGPLRELAGFMAYQPAFTGGVYVAAGDVDFDGVAEIVTGAGAGGGPHVRAWDVFGGGGVGETASFFAYDPGFRGGVRVTADRGVIGTSAGPGGGPHVRMFDGNGVSTATSFFAY